MSESGGCSECPMSSLSDSWVELSSTSSSPIRVTSPLALDHELLLSAQREPPISQRSSTRASPISSALMSLSSTTRNSPMTTPKSPPNSPIGGEETRDELGNVYINHLNYGNKLVTASDVLWEWTQDNNNGYKPSNLKDVRPPALRSRKSSSSSKLSGQSRQCQGCFDENDEHDNEGDEEMKCAPHFDPKTRQSDGAIKRRPFQLFGSKKAILALLISNLISLIVGTGLGVWLTRRATSWVGSKVIHVPL